MILFKKSPRSCVLFFLSTISLFFGFILLFNIIVDPFWYFNLVNIKGFNAIKPHFAHNLRLGKAHQICKQKPTNIVMGTSRVELAFDPNHPGWQISPGITYNLAMGGAGFSEIFKTFQHAYYASDNLKLAVIGLDFFMFNAHREAVVFGTEVFNFDEKRLLLSSNDSCKRTFFHDIDYFLGSKAAIASWSTLTEQKMSDASRLEFYLFNGMRDLENSTLKIVARANGHRYIFSGQERTYVNKIWRAGPERRYCFSYKNIDTLNEFREMVAFAYNKGVDLHFFYWTRTCTHVTSNKRSWSLGTI